MRASRKWLVPTVVGVLVVALIGGGFLAVRALLLAPTTMAPESIGDAGVTIVWPLPAASTTMIPAAVSMEMAACS